MHAATEDGRAYGFAFDDVADFASYVQDTVPTVLRLTLTPFK
ncbi:Beta-1,3-glucanase [Streptomyces sp. di188]|nr:Beta-1,3-glucanase [Streptomyces sp. di50b]SCE21811.1 Beta-1,3-glucanase [Streptomyces sp. di188]